MTGSEVTPAPAMICGISGLDSKNFWNASGDSPLVEDDDLGAVGTGQEAVMDRPELLRPAVDRPPAGLVGVDDLR